MKIAIYGIGVYNDAQNYVSFLIEKLTEKKYDFYIETNFLKELLKTDSFKYPDAKTFSGLTKLDASFDLFFTFGGDGTILSAITIIQDTQIPIVGINTGRLGFLASISKTEFQNKIHDLLSKKFKINPRALLSVELNDKKLDFHEALNEISINRKESTSMIIIEAYLNNELLNSYRADGLIIATPTGSTGYSMSCGGPIVSPENEIFIVTPIAPHNLNIRPFILSDKVEIKLKIMSRAEEYLLSLDSRQYSMKTTSEILLKKATYKINLVQEYESTYLKTIKNKLLWGSDSRN
jgi:NAD+ kinase